ncbi:MAG: carboxypeptidase-like regulatory domain-containing protein [Gemmatimonadetes bacterium]|nr:carboxypeptidase-like regulatory domain-containing protein [Gemmatimonadota bacterium]
MIYGMLYATAVGLPILLAAIVCSGPLRRGGRPERGVWLAGLGLALTLPVAFLINPLGGTSPGDAGTLPEAGLPAVVSGTLPETGVLGLPAVVTISVEPSGLGLDQVLMLAWLVASMVLMLRWVLAAHRLARMGASWRAGIVDGVRVWLTSDVGPAVSGVFRSRILVPSWLASLPHEQRSLVLLHEQEHVRARDPMLIAVSRIARILAPWNPFVWLLSSRLVRAVELDCDRRVLRRRPDVEAYGTTLLTVSSRDPSRLAAAAAFAESEAPLRKRILAMTTPPRAISVLGILTALVLGVVFLVGVFEVPIPAIRIQVDMEPSGSGVAIVEEEPATEVVGTIFSQASLISVRFNDTPINDVLDVFAAFTERSIVASESFTELVTADINREPWDVALGTILAARGLVASTGEDGVIRVDRRAARVGTVTGEVTGEVTDASSGVSVAAAQVFIGDLRLGGLSQQNGRYLLQNVPAGTHTLSVTRMGYRTVEARITVRGGQTVVQGFSITEEALQLDPLIVTGTVGDGVIRVDRRAARVGTVSGRITDAQTGGPVAAVQVYILSLQLGGLSQQDGRYLLQNVRAGTHTLTIARIGYRTVEEQITVGGGQTIEQSFSIAEEALPVDAVVVTGTVGGTTRRSIGNAVSVVDPAAIPAPVTSMQQVLAEWALGNRPLIYVDGMLVRNPFSHPADLENLDPDDVESVEVLSPAAALARYGVRAAAGLVQIRTKR